MATCAKCNHENKANARFCNNCGAPIEQADMINHSVSSESATQLNAQATTTQEQAFSQMPQAAAATPQMAAQPQFAPQPQMAAQGFAADRPTAYAQHPTYEVKHVTCNVDKVQAIINQHQIFFWEVMATNTVVAKESHLEAGKGILDYDTIYSVTTEERFSTIDFRRSSAIPNLARVREIEQQYFNIVQQLESMGCSIHDNYSTLPPKKINWIKAYLLFAIWIYPGIRYIQKIDREYEALRGKWERLTTEMNSLINDNYHVLNLH